MARRYLDPTLRRLIGAAAASAVLAMTLAQQDAEKAEQAAAKSAKPKK